MMYAETKTFTYTIGASLFKAPIVDPALYLIATPIGHLKDISIRALEILASVDYVACEDTRVSRILLARYGLVKKLIVYHEHNASKIGPKLIDLLEKGHSVALMSDAGTPLICDPGFRLVEEVRKKSLKICAIPGACAFVTALTMSGFPADSFVFMGFLPSKQAARLTKLQQAKAMALTTIFYETPQRLLASLEDAICVFGPNHKANIGRELTKKFETSDTLSLDALYQFYVKKEQIRGEIVLLFAPTLKSEFYDEIMIDSLLNKRLKMGDPIGEIAFDVAQITGQKKRDLYQRLLILKQNRTTKL